MAVFTGISDNSSFNPGFAFSDFVSSMEGTQTQFDNIDATLAGLISPSNIHMISSTEIVSNYGNAHLWIQGSFSGTNINIAEATLNFDSGYEISFGGLGAVSTSSTNLNIKAKELSFYTPDGYGIGYFGSSLKFSDSSGSAFGKASKMILLADPDGDGTGNYVELSGSIAMNSYGDFTSGSVKSIKWGTVTGLDSADSPTFTTAGEATGLKLTVSQVQAALVADGFNGLMAAAYSGNDTINATESSDTINAGAGKDILNGLGGDDFLVGGDGNDTINAGAGNDILIGGAGKDILTGGDGADYFVFGTGDNGPTGANTIKDFTSGQDKLWLDLDVFTALDGMTSDQFIAAAKGGADDVLIYNAGKLYYDADAGGAGKAVQIAMVSGLQFSDLAFGHDTSELLI